MFTVMAARPIAASTISFGLVSLPVKLYSVGETASKVRFNWINRDTGSRVKQQYVDIRSGDVVSRGNMIKGYEFAKDQYVTFEPDELKALEAQSKEVIEIKEFVPAEDVGRIYLQRAYYLGPAKGGARAYRLLSAALSESAKVAVAQYAARGKQYLVAIRPIEGGLVLEQLLFKDEVRSFDDVPSEAGEVNDAELELAKQLIEQASSDSFDPGQYQDEVRGRVMELIERKIEGEQITTAPAEEPETKIIDLMEALRASLEGSAAEQQATEEQAEEEGARATGT